VSAAGGRGAGGGGGGAGGRGAASCALAGSRARHGLQHEEAGVGRGHLLHPSGAGEAWRCAGRRGPGCGAGGEHPAAEGWGAGKPFSCCCHRACRRDTSALLSPCAVQNELGCGGEGSGCTFCVAQGRPGRDWALLPAGRFQCPSFGRADWPRCPGALPSWGGQWAPAGPRLSAHVRHCFLFPTGWFGGQDARPGAHTPSTAPSPGLSLHTCVMGRWCCASIRSLFHAWIIRPEPRSHFLSALGEAFFPLIPRAWGMRRGLGFSWVPSLGSYPDPQCGDWKKPCPPGVRERN
jgi:hypothetical protein